MCSEACGDGGEADKGEHVGVCHICDIECHTQDLVVGGNGEGQLLESQLSVLYYAISTSEPVNEDVTQRVAQGTTSNSSNFKIILLLSINFGDNRIT